MKVGEIGRFDNFRVFFAAKKGVIDGFVRRVRNAQSGGGVELSVKVYKESF